MARLISRTKVKPPSLTATTFSVSRIDLVASPPASFAIASYVFEISTNQVTWSSLATQASPNYSATGLVEYNVYFFRARAVDSQGAASTNSSSATARTLAQPPVAPILSLVQVSSTSVTLSLTGASSLAGIASYTFTRGLAVGGPFTLLATQAGASYTDTGLTAGTTYYYRAFATDSQVPPLNSAFSNVVNTVSVNAPPAWSATPAPVFVAGAASTYDLNTICTDPEGDTRAYTSIGTALPTGVTLSGAGILTCTTSAVAGSTSGVRFRATSTGGSADSNAFTLSITPTAAVFGWKSSIPNGYAISIARSSTYDLSQHADIPAGTTPVFTKISGDAGLTVASATGIVTSSAGATLGTANLVVDLVQSGNWAARSTAPGVVVAYDFSAPPANGGTWNWGSLRAASGTGPRVSCELQNENQYPGGCVLDTTVIPPGSSASIRYDIPAGTGERGLQWRFAIDDYAWQYDNGQEFWVQWRVRMNPEYAYHRFKQHNGSGVWDGISYTGQKLNYLSAGPQFPTNAGDVGPPTPVSATNYLYSGPASTAGRFSSNAWTMLDVGSFGEIEITTSSLSPVIDATNAYHYPYAYHGHGYYESFTTKGQDSNYYTDRNAGNEANHVAACQRINPGGGDVYTDFGSPLPAEVNNNHCFVYLPNEWMTIMLRVVLGTWGTGGPNSIGESHAGYQQCTVEYWGGYDPAVHPGAVPKLLHRRTGLTLATHPNNGSQGRERYGQFAVTPFMTQKWTGDAHALAQVWYSQVIWSNTKPADPT
jgi:hypothetical protein